MKGLILIRLNNAEIQVFWLFCVHFMFKVINNLNVDKLIFLFVLFIF